MIKLWFKSFAFLALYEKMDDVSIPIEDENKRLCEKFENCTPGIASVARVTVNELLQRAYKITENCIKVFIYFNTFLIYL